jgi:hypothetical protein
VASRSGSGRSRNCHPRLFSMSVLGVRKNVARPITDKILRANTGEFYDLGPY